MSSYAEKEGYKKEESVEGKKDFYEPKGGLVPKPENKELFEKKKKYAVSELTAAEVAELEDYTSRVMLVGP